MTQIDPVADALVGEWLSLPEVAIRLDLPEELRADEWKGNRGGWQFELSGLRTRAESDRSSS